MSLDPCIPPPAPTGISKPPRLPHRLTHHIGSRHFHRLRHVRPASLPAPAPADGCGKHFADDRSGSLAARPTDGAPAIASGKGAAVLAKVAAGSAASLLAAAAVAGALATSGGLGLVSSFGHSTATNTSVGSTSPTAMGATPGQGLSSPSVTRPIGSPSAGPAVTPVPEPSSLALFAGFALLALTARLVRSGITLPVRLGSPFRDRNYGGPSRERTAAQSRRHDSAVALPATK